MGPDSLRLERLLTLSVSSPGEFPCSVTRTACLIPGKHRVAPPPVPTAGSPQFGA